MSFDKKEYDKKYLREKYRQISLKAKENDIEYIKNFAQNRNLSMMQAVLLAFEYIDSNNITLIK